MGLSVASYLQTEQGLVEGSGKEGVQQILMDKSQPQDSAAESEPGQQGVTDQPSWCVLPYGLALG